MANVLVVGATGYIGHHLAVGIAKEPGLKVSALVRPSSKASPEREAKLHALKDANVSIVTGSTADSVGNLAKLFKPFDTIVSALSDVELVDGQKKLIEAAETSGSIKRFFPSEWGGEFPVTEPFLSTYNPVFKAFLQGKEEIAERLKKSPLEYTRVFCHAFNGYMLPQLGAFGPPPVPEPVIVFGSGNVKGATTNEADIAAYVAKAIKDPELANTKLVIRHNLLTQLEIISIWEGIIGRTLEKKHLSEEELEAQIEAGGDLEKILLGLIKGIWINGLNARDIEGPHYFADKKYPKHKYMTVKDFLTGLAQATGAVKA